jgi:hypothetical protein
MRPIRLALATVALVLALGPAPAAAELQPEDASLVPLFLATCTRPDMNAEAILAGVTGSPEWTEVASPTVDLRALEQVPSRLTGGIFRRPDSVRLWQRNVNGRELTLVIAALPERNVYRHACVLFAPDIRNAMPYFDAFEDGMEAIDLSGRSTDLPHYQEYGNRLVDRRRAHADIFSRSQALSTPRTMHMAIVYE